MAGSHDNGLEESPQARASNAAPLFPRRETGSAAGAPSSVTSRVCDSNGDPSFGDQVAEEIPALCQDAYLTHERANAALKREPAEVQAQVVGLRCSLPPTPYA